MSGRLTRHKHGKIARCVRRFPGVCALAEPALDGEDDGGPGKAASFSLEEKRGRGGGGGALCAGRSYHPTYLLRVNMAAMGIVDDSVDEKSALSLAPAGSWYGTTAPAAAPPSAPATLILRPHPRCPAQPPPAWPATPTGRRGAVEAASDGETHSGRAFACPCRAPWLGASVGRSSEGDVGRGAARMRQRWIVSCPHQ